MKKSTIITMLFALITLSTILLQCKTLSDIVTQGQIKSYVYATISAGKVRQSEIIFIPDVQVIIKNDKGISVDTVISGLDGGFRTKLLPIGKYTIEFNKKNFTLTQYPILINEAVEYPLPLAINYSPKSYIWGTALLKDGSSGYYHQQAFNVDYDTKIRIDNDKSSQVRCNIYGYYLLIYDDNSNSLNVNAKCQTISDNKSLGVGNRLDFTFKNSNPTINEIRAFDNTGRFIQRTRPGALVKLIAVSEDPEKDSLAYIWKISGDNTGFVATNKQQINWTVPTNKGLYSIDVMALDNKGGAAYTNYRIEVGDEGVNFSGVVTDISTNVLIPNASVNINGKFKTTTDARGNFNFKVPQGEDNDRYVLNIECPSYCLKSKIYFNENIGETYQLVPSFTQRFDPKKVVDITEEQDSFTRFSGVVRVFGDSNKLITKDYRRIPARVQIPANSIVDSTGEIVTEDVLVSIRTIDVFNDKALLPGNFGAIRDDKQLRLESFGAIDVQIRSANKPSTKFNLASNAKAQINSPISSILANMAARNSSIPLWDYNQNTGLWEEVGNLVNKGNSYEGITSKFSVLNADVAFTNATMMKLIDNINHPLPSGFITVKLFAPSASGGADFKHDITINTNINGHLPIFVPRLAPNTVITITVISNNVVINTLNQRTLGIVPGAEQWDPTVTNATYQSINNPNILVVKLLPDLLNNVQLNQNQLNRFLDHAENANGLTDANNYYRLIGALDANNDGINGDDYTFATWKAKAGFNADGSGGDANAVYFNAGDLNFWRSMHKKTIGGLTYYYVTNYNNEINAINNTATGAIATVCMEYSPILAGVGNVSVTKFYVFDGPTGTLQRSANLDGNNAGPNAGQKFVPGLCITCHGGEHIKDFSPYVNPIDLQTALNTTPGGNPKFIAFDLRSFFYSPLAGITRLEQEEELRKLNAAILGVNNTSAIVNHLNAAYNNNINTVGQKYIDNAVVGNLETTIPLTRTGSWNNANQAGAVGFQIVPKDFYTDVIAPSCRTCHNSRSSPSLRFEDQGDFFGFKTSINFAVCTGLGNPTRYMPNSKVTFINFWTSQNPIQPEELRKFLNLTSCPPL